MLVVNKVIYDIHEKRGEKKKKDTELGKDSKGPPDVRYKEYTLFNVPDYRSIIKIY